MKNIMSHVGDSYVEENTRRKFINEGHLVSYDLRLRLDGVRVLFTRHNIYISTRLMTCSSSGRCWEMTDAVGQAVDLLLRPCNGSTIPI